MAHGPRARHSTGSRTTASDVSHSRRSPAASPTHWKGGHDHVAPLVLHRGRDGDWGKAGPERASGHFGAREPHLWRRFLGTARRARRPSRVVRRVGALVTL